MDDLFWLLARIVGVVGIALEIIGFISTCPKRMRVTNTLSGVIWTAQAFFVGAWVNMAVHGINTIRKGASIFTLNSGKKTKWAAAGFFSFLITLILLYSPKDLSDYAAFYSGVMGAVAYFCLSNLNSRLALATCSISWAISAAIVGQWELALIQIFVFPTLIAGAFRVHRENKLATA